MTDSTIEIGRREAQALRDAVLRREPQRILIRKAAVLGAGVMGAQIAAHLANANVQPYLFELAAEGKDKNANVKKAIDGLTKLSPSPGAAIDGEPDRNAEVAAARDEIAGAIEGIDNPHTLAREALRRRAYRIDSIA